MDALNKKIALFEGKPEYELKVIPTFDADPFTYGISNYKIDNYPEKFNKLIRKIHKLIKSKVIVGATFVEIIKSAKCKLTLNFKTTNPQQFLKDVVIPGVKKLLNASKMETPTMHVTSSGVYDEINVYYNSVALRLSDMGILTQKIAAECFGNDHETAMDYMLYKRHNFFGVTPDSKVLLSANLVQTHKMSYTGTHFFRISASLKNKVVNVPDVKKLPQSYIPGITVYESDVFDAQKAMDLCTSDILQFYEYFEQYHAHVPHDNVVYVKKLVSRDKFFVLEPKSLADFKQMYDTYRFDSWIDEAGRTSSKNISQLYLDYKNHTEYASVEFSPGAPTAIFDNVYNRWHLNISPGLQYKNSMGRIIKTMPPDYQPPWILEQMYWKDCLTLGHEQEWFLCMEHYAPHMPVYQFLKRLWYVWCDAPTVFMQKQLFYTYLSFFARILKTPSEKLQQAIFIEGGNGVGKTTVALALAELFGTRLSLYMGQNSSSRIAQRFNAGINECVFLILDEFKVTESNKDVESYLYTLISEKRAFSEKKFQDGKETESYANPVMITNDSSNFIVKPGERRIIFNKAGTKYQGQTFQNHDFYNKILNNNTAMCSVAFFLLQHPILHDASFIDFKKNPILTPLKRSLIEKQLSFVHQWYVKCLQQNLVYDLNAGTVVTFLGDAVPDRKLDFYYDAYTHAVHEKKQESTGNGSSTVSQLSVQSFLEALKAVCFVNDSEVTSESRLLPFPCRPVCLATLDVFLRYGSIDISVVADYFQHEFRYTYVEEFVQKPTRHKGIERDKSLRLAQQVDLLRQEHRLGLEQADEFHRDCKQCSQHMRDWQKFTQRVPGGKMAEMAGATIHPYPIEIFAGFIPTGQGKRSQNSTEGMQSMSSAPKRVCTGLSSSSSSGGYVG